MAGLEKVFMNDVAVRISREPNTLVWRENTGRAYQGEVDRTPAGGYVRIEPGMVVLRKARLISFGLPGIGDIVGICHGKPTVVETKTLTGRLAEKQAKFGAAWRAAGGTYIVTRTMDDLKRKLRGLYD